MTEEKKSNVCEKYNGKEVARVGVRVKGMLGSIRDIRPRIVRLHLGVWSVSDTMDTRI